MIRPALITLIAVTTLAVLSACGGGSASLESAAISSSDVPSAWLPSDLDDAKGQALWDTLPQLLTKDSAARIIIHAFEAESGLHGVATMFIETDDAAVIPAAAEDDEVLGPLSLLLMSEDALLLPDPIGGDPNAYFAVSELPVPGSIRSRLIRLIDEDLIHSDSLTFSVGNVLAVVTVWYPEEEGPAEDLGEIALTVEARLQSVVPGS